jgi:ubiquinone/menaquinone biosynthesis C-methylase UbiE
MESSTQKIKEDFDRIASLPSGGWNHSAHYYSFLLKQVPRPCINALEIGCGTGSFTRLLAHRCKNVLALDLSPEMIRVARDRSGATPNIKYEIGDVVSIQLPTNHFDCVASIATLHHLPLEDMLLKMKESLTVGGTLIVLDLFEIEKFTDALLSALAYPVSAAMKILKGSRLRTSRVVREVWAEHNRSDSYPTMSKIRKLSALVLPGARIKRHLFCRYSITWVKGGLTRRSS